MRSYNIKVLLVTVVLGLAVAIGGCSTIQLVSNYDETIDKQAQELQKKLDGYFISLQSAGVEDLKYKNQQKFYEGALTDLRAMEVRAVAIDKNKLTIEQLALAKENLAYLVLLHKGCISKPLDPDQMKKIKDNGIDLSLDCQKQFGATEDVAGRGDIAINPYLIGPVQDLFNQHLGAVMAFELAKKRGENQKTGKE